MKIRSEIMVYSYVQFEECSLHFLSEQKSLDRDPFDSGWYDPWPHSLSLNSFRVVVGLVPALEEFAILEGEETHWHHASI